MPLSYQLQNSAEQQQMRYHQLQQQQQQAAAPPRAAPLDAHLSRSPTQHLRDASANDAQKEMADVLMLDEAALTQQQAQHNHALSPHSKSLLLHSLRVDTHRSGGAAPPSAIPPSAPPAVQLAPPSGLSTSPASSAEPSSTHSSMQSSTDSSPQNSYRGLKINMNGARDAGAHVTSSGHSASSVGQHSGRNESSDESYSGGGMEQPASGQGEPMQIATPHPVPNAAATVRIVSATSSAASFSSSSSSSSVAPKVRMQPEADIAAGNGATTTHHQQPQQSTPITSSTSGNSTASNSGGAESSANSASSANSSSTPPTAVSSTTPPASSTSAPKSGGRYKPVRTLQNSLFGQVQLAFDTLKGVEVAVKVSHSELVNPKNQVGSSSSATSAATATQQADAAATARSQAGVSVLEDVRREARILRLLLGADQPPLTTATIDDATCGLSNALLHAIHLPANAVVQPGATNPLTIKQQFLDSISKGKKSIAGFYDEVEAESFHYLISEYISGGDLFSVLTAQPQHKVSEGVARQWFYQLCCSVRFLHAQSVAHLDLSLENCCMDSAGHIRLIDFGLAAQHPKYNGNKRSFLADGTVQRNASNHIKLIDESPATASCECAACQMSSNKLLETDPAIQACLQSGHSISKLKYLCRPVCEKVHKPGKLGYMSCELYNNQSWDAYAHDTFGLGVILYSMLTGRPPFTRPDEAADVWFKVIYSGQWLLPQVRQQPPAAIYNTLSPNALHLIDMLIKPQHLRPSIDVVLKHPFLNPQHPGNAAPSKIQAPTAMGGSQLAGRKTMQRRGSE